MTPDREAEIRAWTTRAAPESVMANPCFEVVVELVAALDAARAERLAQANEIQSLDTELAAARAELAKTVTELDEYTVSYRLAVGERDAARAELAAERASHDRLVDLVAQVSHAVGISETMTPEERVRAMGAELARVTAERDWERNCNLSGSALLVSLCASVGDRMTSDEQERVGEALAKAHETVDHVRAALERVTEDRDAQLRVYAQLIAERRDEATRFRAALEMIAETTGQDPYAANPHLWPEQRSTHEARRALLNLPADTPRADVERAWAERQAGRAEPAFCGFCYGSGESMPGVRCNPCGGTGRERSGGDG